MKRRPQGIEALTVRRANVADADKVRYRVYSSPTEFIAVIAESALMAVKVAGISKPHKIVRDLPTEGIAIEAKKMAVVPENPEQFTWPVQSAAPPQRVIADLMPKTAESKQQHFKPMTLGDLQRTGVPRARILPPEMLNQIIEAHTKSKSPLAVQNQLEEAPQHFPVSESLSAPSPAATPNPALATASPKERITQMMEEMFTEAAPAPSEQGPVLSPEEVERLLNG